MHFLESAQCKQRLTQKERRRPGQHDGKKRNQNQNQNPKKTKTFSAMNKKKLLKLTSGILAIVLLISFLLMLNPVADKVGEMTGHTGDKIAELAKSIFLIAIALFLISSGVAAMAVPVVGITLVVVGVGLLAYKIWPLFNKDDDDDKPE
jgi:uncharacterized membrane protein YidH (DUF202 family)